MPTLQTQVLSTVLSQSLSPLRRQRRDCVGVGCATWNPPCRLALFWLSFLVFSVNERSGLTFETKVRWREDRKFLQVIALHPARRLCRYYPWHFAVFGFSTVPMRPKHTHTHTNVYLLPTQNNPFVQPKLSRLNNNTRQPREACDDSRPRHYAEVDCLAIPENRSREHLQFSSQGHLNTNTSYENGSLLQYSDEIANIAVSMFATRSSIQGIRTSESSSFVLSDPCLSFPLITAWVSLTPDPDPDPGPESQSLKQGTDHRIIFFNCVKACATGFPYSQTLHLPKYPQASQMLERHNHATLSIIILLYRF